MKTKLSDWTKFGSNYDSLLLETKETYILYRYPCYTWIFKEGFFCAWTWCILRRMLRPVASGTKGPAQIRKTCLCVQRKTLEGATQLENERKSINNGGHYQLQKKLGLLLTSNSPLYHVRGLWWIGLGTEPLLSLSRLAGLRTRRRELFFKNSNQGSNSLEALTSGQERRGRRWWSHVISRERVSRILDMRGWRRNKGSKFCGVATLTDRPLILWFGVAQARPPSTPRLPRWFGARALGGALAN